MSTIEVEKLEEDYVSAEEAEELDN